MAFKLAPEAAAAGYRLAAFETIGSTSAEAMACARTGGASPLWIVSGHQTAGRGRRGSAWETPPGNLAASLLLTTDLPPATVATLGFVAGLALVQALDGCCASFEAGLRPAPQDEVCGSLPSPPHAEVRALASLEARTTFTLKWPNDVLAGGAKLAGILLETEEAGQGRAVVVGIGVNVAHVPVGLPYRTASLAALGVEVPAEGLFARLSAAWVDLDRIWDRGRGFEAIRLRWLARAAGLGGPVAIKTADAVREGTFETIDERGQLVLRMGDGTTRRISAGEVHFGDAATLHRGAAA